MKLRTLLIKAKVLFFVTALSGGMLQGQFGFTNSTAMAQSPPPVVGEYLLSANFDCGAKLHITTQFGFFIEGIVEADSRMDGMTGSVSVNSLSGEVSITFTRTGPGFTQVYKGKFVPNGCRTTAGCQYTFIYGTFSHNGSGTFGWYATR